MEQMIRAKDYILIRKKKTFSLLFWREQKTTLMQAEVVLVVYKQGSTRTRDTAKKIKESCLHNVRRSNALCARSTPVSTIVVVLCHGHVVL